MLTRRVPRRPHCRGDRRARRDLTAHSPTHGPAQLGQPGLDDPRGRGRAVRRRPGQLGQPHRVGTVLRRRRACQRHRHPAPDRESSPVGAERTAQEAVGVSFWLLAPSVAAQAAHDLLTRTHPGHSRLVIVLTASSLLVMPALGKAKHHLGARLGSAATAGEGTQNLHCASLVAAVLVGVLAITALGWWWLDSLIALTLALAVAPVREGRQAWAGEGCC